MPRAQLLLLGGFQAFAANARPAVLPARSQALLARLALRPGEAHSRDKLAALLWSDAPAARARQSLRQALLTIRRGFGEGHPSLLLDQGDAVALNDAAVGVDTSSFERLIALRTPAALEEAAAVYRGELLEGLAGQSAAFEEWLLAERERLRELALEVLAELLRRHAETGNLAGGIHTAGRFLVLEPADEPVHRTLMRLYARQGRRAAALRQYQLCTAALKRELGVNPEPATRELYRELLQSSPATRSGSGAATLPEAAPSRTVAAVVEASLVGRQAELALFLECRARAWRSRGQVAVVVGEAGIGKTRLMEAVSQDALEHGGQVLLGRSYESAQILPCGPWVNALRNGGVVSAIVGDTGLGGPFRPELARLIPELGPVEPRATASAEEHLRLFEAMGHVVETLARRQPLLLVLEDLHWSDDLSARLLAFVAHRLAAWPVLLLVTAREEELSGVPALGRVLAELDREAHAVRVTLGPLSREETSSLIRHLARAGREPAAVERLGDRIWKASGGNPFVAIETVRAIDEGAEPGDAGPLPVPERVRATIVARLQRLHPRTQELAAVAAVIGRKFSFVLVQRATGLEPADAAQSVEELVAHQILHVVDDELDFTHERIREMAYARLLPPRRQLLHAMVARAIEALHPDRLDELADRLAHHYAKTDLDDKAVEYLARFAERAAQGYANAEAVLALKEALARARRAPGGGSDDRILALLDTLSLSLAILGRFREILELLLLERERAERIRNRALASAYFFRLGLTYSYLGQPEDAVTFARRALAEAERCGSDHAVGRACYVLALAAYYTGESAAGVDHARRGIACLERGTTRADLAWLGQTWWVLGLHLYLRGEFDAGLRALEEVEAVARRMGGEPRLSSFAAWTTGLILVTRGQWEEGIERCRRSLAEAPDPVNMALARGRLGSAYLEKGEAAEARPLLEQAVEQLARFRFTQVEGLYTAFLAEARRLTGDAAGARQAAERAVALTEDSRYPFGLACARRSLGRVVLAAGDPEAASVQLEEALAIFASIGARFEVARTELELAELAYAQGDVAGTSTRVTGPAEAFAAMGVRRYDARVRALRTLVRPASSPPP